MHALNLMHEGVVHGLGEAYVNGHLREITWCLWPFEWYVTQGASWVITPVNCIACLASNPHMRVIKLTLKV